MNIGTMFDAFLSPLDPQEISELENDLVEAWKKDLTHFSQDILEWNNQLRKEEQTPLIAKKIAMNEKQIADNSAFLTTPNEDIIKTGITTNKGDPFIPPPYPASYLRVLKDRLEWATTTTRRVVRN